MGDFGGEFAAIQYVAGTSNWIADLTTALGLAQTVYLPPGIYPVDSLTAGVMTPLTVPAGKVLMFAPGAMLDLSATDVSLEVLGSVVAGRHQIFVADPGKVKWLSNQQDELYPEWWGARAVPVSDLSMQAAIAAATVRRGPDGVPLPPLPIVLAGGVYSINSSLEVNQDDTGEGDAVGFILRGVGGNTADVSSAGTPTSSPVSILRAAAGLDVMMTFFGPGAFAVEDVCFDGAGHADECVRVTHRPEATSGSNRAQVNAFVRCAFINRVTTEVSHGPLVNVGVLGLVAGQATPAGSPSLTGTAVGDSTGAWVGLLPSMLVFDNCAFYPSSPSDPAVNLDGPFSLQVEFNACTFRGTASAMIYGNGVRFGVSGCNYYNMAPYAADETGEHIGGIDIFLGRAVLDGPVLPSPGNIPWSARRDQYRFKIQWYRPGDPAKEPFGAQPNDVPWGMLTLADGSGLQVASAAQGTSPAPHVAPSPGASLPGTVIDLLPADGTPPSPEPGVRGPGDTKLLTRMGAADVLHSHINVFAGAGLGPKGSGPEAGSTAFKKGGHGSAGQAIPADSGSISMLASCVATDCYSNSPQFLGSSRGSAGSVGNTTLTSVRHEPISPAVPGESDVAPSVLWRMNLTSDQRLGGPLLTLVGCAMYASVQTASTVGVIDIGTLFTAPGAPGFSVDPEFRVPSRVAPLPR